MICQKKNKRLLVFCLSFLLFCLAVIPCLSSVESYASETTTQTVDDYFREHNFYETCAFVCRKYASFPYTDYLTGASSGIVYDNFATYLENKGKSDLLQEDVTITGTSGGRGYDMPQDVRQELLNFVQEVYINENAPNYSVCTITSYNFLNPSLFVSAQQFNSCKEFIKNSDAWVLIDKADGYTNMQGTTNLVVIPRQNMVDLVGSVSGGSFSSVTLYYNWNSVNLYNMRNIPNAKFYTMTQGGVITQGNFPNIGDSAIVNGATPVNNKFLIMSSFDKNETVYVFPTLNALKNYNSYNPQAYYLPSNSQSIVPYYDGFTDKDLASAGNFYNNIVINTSGDSPTEIKKKTDSILGSLDSIFGGTDSESSSGGLFDSLGDIITGATGAISPIKEIVLGDIKDLVADVFDFLPPTIITLWVSGIIFGIFFGVLKLIRG